MPAIIVKSHGPHVTIIPFPTMSETLKVLETFRPKTLMADVWFVSAPTGMHYFPREHIIAVSIDNGEFPDWLKEQHSQVMLNGAAVKMLAEQQHGKKILPASLLPS